MPGIQLKGGGYSSSKNKGFERWVDLAVGGTDEMSGGE